MNYVHKENNDHLAIPCSITARNYTIKFVELGLPAGTNWSVSFNYQTKSSVYSTIEFLATNGSYFYSVKAIENYMITNGSGTINVTGKPVTVNVIFTPYEYNLFFNVSGLSAHSVWKLNIYGITFNGEIINVSYAINSSSFRTALPNGSYNYELNFSKEYSPENAKGFFDVSGSEKAFQFNVHENYQSINLFLVFIVLVIVVLIVSTINVYLYLRIRNRKIK